MRVGVLALLFAAGSASAEPIHITVTGTTSGNAPDGEIFRPAVATATIDSDAIDEDPNPNEGRYRGARVSLRVDWFSGADWDYSCDARVSVLVFPNIGSSFQFDAESCPVPILINFNEGQLETDVIAEAVLEPWGEAQIASPPLFYSEDGTYVVPEPSGAGLVALLALAVLRRRDATLAMRNGKRGPRCRRTESHIPKRRANAARRDHG